MRRRYLSFFICHLSFSAALFLTGCQDTDELTGNGNVEVENMIHVGGISNDGLVATAAVTRTDPIDEETVQRTDAENIPWLVTPLEQGLDITYGNYDSDWHRINSRVAILKLLTEEGGGIKYSVDGTKKYAEYSFLYRDDSNGNPTENPAIWYRHDTPRKQLRRRMYLSGQSFRCHGWFGQQPVYVWQYDGGRGHSKRLFVPPPVAGYNAELPPSTC